MKYKLLIFFIIYSCFGCDSSQLKTPSLQGIWGTYESDGEYVEVLFDKDRGMIFREGCMCFEVNDYIVKDSVVLMYYEDLNKIRSSMKISILNDSVLNVKSSGGNLYEHSKLFSGTYDIDSIINVQETFIDEFIKRKQKHE